MRFSTIFAATAVAGSAMAADHIVVVGKNGLSFEPNTTTAAKGDTVTFKFWPANHSIAQGPFGSPCNPSTTGFWSGYVPTSDKTAASSTTFMYTVQNASQPIWFYCTQGKHCQSGMVGVINPPSAGANTIAAYAEGAKNATANVQPTSKASDNPGFGMLMVNGTMTTNTTSAASSTQVNGLALAGLGLVSYMLM